MSEEVTYPPLPAERAVLVIRRILVREQNNKTRVDVDFLENADREVQYRAMYRRSYWISYLAMSRDNYQLAELRQLLNAAAPGSFVGEKFELGAFVNATGGKVLVEWVPEWGVRSGLGRPEPVWKTICEHPSLRIRRLLEWGDLPASSLEPEIGNAEREMEVCEQQGDTKYADQWAEFILWATQRSRA